MDHAGLALMHGGDELQGGEGLMGDFAAGEDVREDADDLSAAGKAASATAPMRPTQAPP